MGIVSNPSVMGNSNKNVGFVGRGSPFQWNFAFKSPIEVQKKQFHHGIPWLNFNWYFGIFMGWPSVNDCTLNPKDI